MNLSLTWKSENFGAKAPHVALRISGGRFDGTYGVYALSVRRGQAVFHPIGSGRGLSEQEAIAGAKRCNASMSAPSEAMGQQF